MAATVQRERVKSIRVARTPEAAGSESESSDIAEEVEPVSERVERRASRGEVEAAVGARRMLPQCKSRC